MRMANGRPSHQLPGAAPEAIAHPSSAESRGGAGVAPVARVGVAVESGSVGLASVGVAVGDDVALGVGSSEKVA